MANYFEINLMLTRPTAERIVASIIKQIDELPVTMPKYCEAKAELEIAIKDILRQLHKQGTEIKPKSYLGRIAEQINFKI